MTMDNIQTYSCKIGNVTIGGGADVAIQSMTNTDTADIAATVTQITELAQAGSQLVRITIDRPESAAAVADIITKLRADGITTPIVGDFHYNGHSLLQNYPDMAAALDKYRINPGNVGFHSKKNQQFTQMIEAAIYYNKPVRIGVNWGSLDQQLLAKIMDENSHRKQPKSSSEVMIEALTRSALESAQMAEAIGLAKDKIVLSAKISRVPQMQAAYRWLAENCRYPLHLGLTEAGMGNKAIIASTAALAPLLQQGIGDTIRVSLTPQPNSSRCQEVEICQEILQALELRTFMPQVTACPGCGRTTSTFFQSLAENIQQYLRKQMPVWRNIYPGAEQLKVAVMGCIVNGPGESKHADIGISLPGTGESPAAPVFIDGKKVATLRGNNIAAEFQQMISDYVKQRFSQYQPQPTSTPKEANL